MASPARISSSSPGPAAARQAARPPASWSGAATSPRLERVLLPVRKAASFSARRRTTSAGGPCSPPVPIPRKASAAPSEDEGPAAALPLGHDSPEYQYISHTQREAQLWDQYWHFKLSLEARESFEKGRAPDAADAADAADRAGGRPRGSSLASTGDDSELLSLGDDAAAVFEMDDL